MSDIAIFLKNSLDDVDETPRFEAGNRHGRAAGRARWGTRARVLTAHEGFPRAHTHIRARTRGGER